MDQLLNQTVVVDVDAPFVFVGTLMTISDKTLTLDHVDVHDLRDSETTRERYILDTRIHGIRPNRDRTYVQRNQVVSVSALSDVLE